MRVKTIYGSRHSIGECCLRQYSFRLEHTFFETAKIVIKGLTKAFRMPIVRRLRMKA